MKLSRDRILETALGIVVNEGWAALSMRRLAQELDVWPMAIYRHFSDKEALLDAIAAAAADRAKLPAEGDWRGVVEALLDEARLLFSSDGVGGGALASLAEPGGTRLAEAGQAALARGGLAPQDAVEAWRALVAYAIGSRLLGGPDEEARFREGLSQLLD